MKNSWVPMFMVFASFIIMSMAGSSYMFGVLSGLIYDLSPPWLVLIIGSAMNFGGYFAIWLAVTHCISQPQVWHICIYIFLGGNSESLFNTAALVTAVKNFPESRGIIVGLSKGFVGLSGAILTQLYLAVYGDDSGSLILLITWLPAAICVWLAPTCRIIEFVQQQKKEINLWNTKRSTIEEPVDQTTIESTPPTEEVPPLSATPISRLTHMLKAPKRGEDYTVLQALFSFDMLILFVATICNIGGALTVIDNIGQIGMSLGYPSRSISTLVSLVSIWNYLGRVAVGFVSEIFVKKYKLPRPLMLTMILFLSCIGHLLIAFGVPGSLYASSVIIGFCFGAEWTLILAIISEIFGLKYYSSLLNFEAMASLLGMYILNVIVAGHLYDKQAGKLMVKLGSKRATGKGLDCSGVQCYKLSFIIITALILFGSLFSLILVLRTRKFYRIDIYRKFREEGMEMDMEIQESSERNVEISSSVETTVGV